MAVKATPEGEGRMKNAECKRPYKAIQSHVKAWGISQ